jgi:outer membrane protein assembly factor BamB
MGLDRRSVLKLGGLLGVGGLTALAGCSSSCPDSGHPTPEETVPISRSPVGPFEDRPTSTWPTESGDAANTGYVPTDGPHTPLSVRWETQLDVPTEDGVGITASAPVVGPEGVYVADPEGVHALSLRTGEVTWESSSLPVTSTDQYASYRPETVAPRVVPEGLIAVGLDDGLAALDPADGTVQWRDRSQTDVAPPTVANGLLIAQGADSVRGFDVAGSEQWDVRVSRGDRRHQPAATDDVVVIESEVGVVGLAPDTGDRLWDHSTMVETAPVVDGDTCFVGTEDGLLALSVADGTEQWSHSRGDYMTLRSLVVGPESVYVVERPPEAGAAAFAFSRSGDGVEPRWCSSIGDGVLAAATHDRALGLHSVAGSERSLAGFTADRGELPWAVTGGSRSDRWLNPPAVLEDAIVLTTRGGHTVAIGGGA